MQREVKSKKQNALPGARSPESRRVSVAAYSTHPILRLQQDRGNRAIQRLFGFLTAKPKPHTPSDADLTAERKHYHDRVLPDTGPVGPAQSASEVLRTALGSSGEPLDQSTRTFFERRLRRDFSDVRVHTGTRAAASAAELAALAYSVGNDVVFAAGQFKPETPSGRYLLAHELAHVVQAQGAAATGPMRLSSPDDPFEHEADRVARDQALPARRTASRTVFRQVERDLRKLEPYFPYQQGEYLEHFGEQVKRDLRTEILGRATNRRSPSGCIRTRRLRTRQNPTPRALL